MQRASKQDCASWTLEPERAMPPGLPWHATGVDVAAAMVEIAAQRHPAASFVEASVTELPFPDGSFDAAVGNIVIQHVGAPECAAREIARVLVPGGRIALSTWDAPERSPFFAALLGAIADAQVPPPSGVPPGPSFFQYANDDAFVSLLRAAGFDRLSIDIVTIEFPLDSVDDLITALAGGTVRTGALLRAADDAQRQVVRTSLDARPERWRGVDGYRVPAPVKIASGRKHDHAADRGRPVHATGRLAFHIKPLAAAKGDAQREHKH